MTTFFSGVQTYTWRGYRVNGTLNGNVSRSGNTVTLSNLVLALSIPDGSGWGSDILTFTLSGVGTSFYATASGTSLGSYTLNNASFSVNVSDTSKTVSWSSSDGFSGSFVVTFPGSGTAPDVPTITVSDITDTSAKLSYGITSFGNPPSGTIALYCDTNSYPITVVEFKHTTGISDYLLTNLVPGTTYYAKVNADNGSFVVFSEVISFVARTPTAYKLYGSVNGESELITKLYGSVNGSAKRIVKFYGSVNGLTKRIY